MGGESRRGGEKSERASNKKFPHFCSRDICSLIQIIKTIIDLNRPSLGTDLIKLNKNDCPLKYLMRSRISIPGELICFKYFGRKSIT